MIRSFLAVELPDPVKDAIGTLQKELRMRLDSDLGKSLRIQWVQPTSIHLTMKFLGEIEDALIEPIRGAVAKVVATLEAGDLSLTRLGCFPNPQAPRVLWVGPSDEDSAAERQVAELHRTIETVMEELGFARENKAFRPHLTLARVKAGERQAGLALAKNGLLDRPLALGVLPIRRVALMKSDLRPSGAVYTRLWDVRIGGS